MEISINKIIGNAKLTEMAAKHLAYSMRDIQSYHELTPKEREIISIEQFKEIAAPAVEVYHSLKEKNPSYIILVCVGKYYKTFDDDAKKVSNILGITLFDNGETLFSCHALDTYLPRLIRAGYKVGITNVS